MTRALSGPRGNRHAVDAACSESYSLPCRVREVDPLAPNELGAVNTPARGKGLTRLCALRDE